MHCVSQEKKEEEEEEEVIEKEAKEQKQVAPLDLLPDDIVAHALSFLGDVSNRFALQATCQQFHRLSSTPSMMKHIAVGGDPETGMHGIILETDTAASATDKLTPFCAAGNVEAIYMCVR